MEKNKIVKMEEKMQYSLKTLCEKGGNQVLFFSANPCKNEIRPTLVLETDKNMVKFLSRSLSCYDASHNCVITDNETLLGVNTEYKGDTTVAFVKVGYSEQRSGRKPEWFCFMYGKEIHVASVAAGCPVKKWITVYTVDEVKQHLTKEQGVVVMNKTTKRILGIWSVYRLIDGEYKFISDYDGFRFDYPYFLIILNDITNVIHNYPVNYYAFSSPGYVSCSSFTNAFAEEVETRLKILQETHPIRDVITKKLCYPKGVDDDITYSRTFLKRKFQDLIKTIDTLVPEKEL